METKIEYQLTPELASQLITEAADLQITGGIKHKWKSPILFGSLFALLLFWHNYPFAGVLKVGDADFSIATKFLEAVLVIAVGFGFGFGGVLFFRKNVRAGAIEEARKHVTKSETFRKVYWDDSTLALASQISETKVKWQIIDKVVQGKCGVYVFSDNVILFSIPKAVLPINLPSEELIRSWNSFIAQAKQIKS